jgi:hypothetical protein
MVPEKLEGPSSGEKDNKGNPGRGFLILIDISPLKRETKFRKLQKKNKRRCLMVQKCLESLKLVEDSIEVKSKPFAKSSFFKEKGPVRLSMSGNFMELILKETPESIPAFEGKMSKFRLTRHARSPKILKELGRPQPFTFEEFAAIIRTLLLKQRRGQIGHLFADNFLKNDNHVNIFYLKKGRYMFEVFVRWYSFHSYWHLGAGPFYDDDDFWGLSQRIFIRE